MILGDADEHTRAEFLAFTLKVLILLGGGLFLLVKSQVGVCFQNIKVDIAAVQHLCPVKDIEGIPVATGSNQ